MYLSVCMCVNVCLCVSVCVCARCRCLFVSKQCTALAQVILSSAPPQAFPSLVCQDARLCDADADAMRAGRTAAAWARGVT